MACLLQSARREEKAAEAVQQLVRCGFDVVEFAIGIDLFLRRSFHVGEVIKPGFNSGLDCMDSGLDCTGVKEFHS